MYPDNIFGDLSTAGRRAQTQREARTAAKPLPRISPADSRPGQPMKWGAAQNADLRRAWPVLRAGARRTMHLAAAAGADGRALTVVNPSAEPRAVTVAVTGLAEAALNVCGVRAFPDHVTIELPPQTGALRLAPAE